MFDIFLIQDPGGIESVVVVMLFLGVFGLAALYGVYRLVKWLKAIIEAAAGVDNS